MRTETRESGPAVITPQGRPHTDLLSTTDMAMVTGISGTGRLPRSVARVLPLANGSQAAPYPGKVLWRVLYRCGACGCSHIAHSREEIATGRRTAPCGRRVWLVIRRTDRGGQVVV